MGELYIITDTHLNQKKLTTGELGPDVRPENFTEQIIENWKRVVPADATVIHLGDVIMGKNGTLGTILNSLPGTKILVRGNHDLEKGDWYRSHGFHFVCDYFLEHGIFFSHVPKIPLPEEAEYCIHGHFHRDEHRKALYQTNWFYSTHRHKYLLLEIESTLAPVRLQDFLDNQKLDR